MAVEGALRGVPLSLTTTFGLTTATNDLDQGAQHASTSVPISPRTVVLPNNFYGAYEALAARLAASAPGARLPIYVSPMAEISADDHARRAGTRGVCHRRR